MSLVSLVVSVCLGVGAFVGVGMVKSLTSCTLQFCTERRTFSYTSLSSDQHEKKAMLFCVPFDLLDLLALFEGLCWYRPSTAIQIVISGIPWARCAVRKASPVEAPSPMIW